MKWRPVKNGGGDVKRRADRQTDRQSGYKTKNDVSGDCRGVLTRVLIANTEHS